MPFAIHTALPEYNDEIHVILKGLVIYTVYKYSMQILMDRIMVSKTLYQLNSREIQINPVGKPRKRP